MKGTILSLAIATAFASGAQALQLEKRDNPRAVHVPMQRSQASPEKREEMRQRRAARLGKRAGTVSETLDNVENGALYFANVTVGTPAQSLRFHIDTGSSDLWANSATSTFCEQSAQTLEQEGYEPCTVSGTYAANKSSTYKYVNSKFFIQYADTTGASGDYVADTVRFGTTDLTSQQFGVGYASNSSEGVMGIGYPNLEVAVQYDRGSSYANIPQNMANQGLINTPAYSLWLDDLQSSTGNILFGGVDTSKFTGELTTVPIVAEQNEYLEMIVALSGISIDNNGKSTTLLSTATPVLLDSGSTLMYLPSSVAQSIYSAVGATYSSRQGVATIPCSSASSTTMTLGFTFSGKTIQIAMSQLVLNEGSSKTCLFGIVPQSSSGTYTLGDTFLRSAYVVYDLDANTISLAQTNFNPGTDSNIKEIVSGTAGVPSATGATATASISGAVATGANVGNTGATAVISTFTSGAKPTAAPMWGAAALGVGAGAIYAAM